jgi:hypothetical protein
MIQYPRTLGVVTVRVPRHFLAGVTVSGNNRAAKGALSFSRNVGALTTTLRLREHPPPCGFELLVRGHLGFYR